jgi:hypothetical protein
MIFSHVIRHRVPSILGINPTTVEGARDGSYLQSRLECLYNPVTDVILPDLTARKGQTIHLKPYLNLEQIRNHQETILLVVNPQIQESCTTQGFYLIEQSAGDSMPALVAHVRKDVNLTDLPWLVRLYILAE